MPKVQFRPDPNFDFHSLLARWRKREAESDHHAPQINAVNFVGLRTHATEAEIYVQRTRENNDFLRKYFNLLLTKGDINSFREPHTVVRMKSNNLNKVTAAQELLRENKILLQKIQQISPDATVTSHRPLGSKCQRQRAYKRFVPPTEILSKYKNIELPKGEHLWRVLRPRIWFDFEVLCGPYSTQGRLTIELYTEAAPMVVREFIKCCACKFSDRVQMLRLFPNLWLEGEIKLSDDNRLINRGVEYDMRALQHDAGPGILSFPLEFVDGFHYGALSFTISSRPLHVLNGKRVAFGRLINSMRTMKVLQEYGTKNGKLKKPLRVIACGLQPYS